MNVTKIAKFLDNFSFMLIILFCFGFFTPHLTQKISLMENDSIAVMESLSGSNFIKQIFWIVFFILLSWRGIKQEIFTRTNFKTLVVILFMTSGLAIISSIWSEYPFLTIKRGLFQLIFCFCVVVSFFLSFKKQTTELCLVYAAILVTILTIFTILIGVGFSPGNKLVGFTKGKNVLGQNLLVLISLLVIQVKIYGQNISITKFVVGILLGLLLLTVSKTSIFLLFVFILLAQSNIVVSKFIRTFSFLALIVIFIALPSFSYFLGTYVHIGLFLEPTAITGRGMIWDTLYFDLDYYSKIIYGYGYGAYFGNGTTPLFFDDDWSFLKHIASSHNGYLDIFIQYGFFFSMIIVICLCHLCGKIKDKWLNASFVIPIIYNFTESAFIKDQSMMWLLTVLLFANVAVIKNAYKHEKLESLPKLPHFKLN